MSSPEPDWDAWAKDDCECGHARYRHKSGTGPCDKTRLRRVKPEGLPDPIYPPDDDGDPWGSWPSNWPPYSEWPTVEAPCCSAFYEAGAARAEAGPE